MFLRIALVRCIVALFLVYALSPLTFAASIRENAPRDPLVRLLLLDIIADLTAPLAGNGPTGDAEQPLEVLLKKQRAVLRKPLTDPVPPLVVPALSTGQHFLVPPQSSRNFLEFPVRLPLTGARLSYVGLSPPARPA